MSFAFVDPHSNKGLTQTTKGEKHKIKARLFQYTNRDSYCASRVIRRAHSCPYSR